jgi:hypothetical protein
LSCRFASVPRDARQTALDELAVLRLQFDSEVCATCEGCRDEGAAGTCKGIEDDLARLVKVSIRGFRMPTDFSVGWQRLPE